MKTKLILFAALILASCEKEKLYECRCELIHEKFPPQTIPSPLYIKAKKTDAFNECQEQARKLTGTRFGQQTVGVCKIQ